MEAKLLRYLGGDVVEIGFVTQGEHDFLQTGSMRRQDLLFDAADRQDAALKGCLLYTSPSPRDRS